MIDYSRREILVFSPKKQLDRSKFLVVVLAPHNEENETRYCTMACCFEFFLGKAYREK
jgi:hypothetical protein